MFSTIVFGLVTTKSSYTGFGHRLVGVRRRRRRRSTVVTGLCDVVEPVLASTTDASFYLEDEDGAGLGVVAKKENAGPDRPRTEPENYRPVSDCLRCRNRRPPPTVQGIRL